MAFERGRPLAIVLIGLLLAGLTPVGAQSSQRQQAQTDAKKKTAQAKASKPSKPSKAAQAKQPKAKTAKATQPPESAPVRSAPARNASAQALPVQSSAIMPVGPMPPPSVEERAAPQSDTQQREQSAAPFSFRASPTQLNMVQTAPEQIGQVPGDFFWIRQGLQAVRDPVDGALVFLNDEGRVLGRATLPAGFDINQIVGEPGQVRLVGESRHVVVPRNIDPAATPSLQDGPVIGMSSARQLRLVRRGPQHLALEDERRAGGRALDVRSVAGGHLAQAYDVGPGSGDHRYVVSEEIISAKPSLQVRVFVQRFDRDGKLTGLVSVPLDGMDTIPHDFITVTGDGSVRVLAAQGSGVKIKEFGFVPPPQGNRRGDAELRSLGRALREVPVDTNLRRPEGTQRFLPPEASQFRVVVPTPPISRDQILKNAAEYLSVNWTMGPENFSRAGIDNECSPNEAKFWRRPARFTSASIGQTIGPMPYRWGGDDTPTTYKIRLQWGALAGDVCTCRNPALDYCLAPESVGIDCSGLVSRAWGIEKRGTSGLLDVSTYVDRWEDVRPGDAFNWPGRHIRLFAGRAPGAALAFIVIEASTRIECEGACMRTYRPSEMSGYRIIRYRGVTE